MNRERRCLKIVIDRKAGLVLLAVVLLVGGAGLLSSQNLTMSATYPIPAGVYNQIVTTGDSGTTPANTILNRNKGNTILVPPTNAGGNVGVGNAAPASYAKLDVNTSGNKAVHTMDKTYGGLLLGYNGPTIQARTTADGNAANLSLQAWGGNVGIGTGAPASKLSVAGGVQLGDDTSACTAGNDGTLKWASGTLEVCSSGAWQPAGAAPVPTLSCNYYSSGGVNYIEWTFAAPPGNLTLSTPWCPPGCGNWWNATCYTAPSAKFASALRVVWGFAGCHFADPTGCGVTMGGKRYTW